MPANDSTATYEKLRLTVRYWLLGRRYNVALRAMEFAAKHHVGLRKDGSPEFSHQVWQVSYARTVADLLSYPEETIATIFLHDTVEDYDVTVADIENLFGTRIAHSVDKMSKVVEGVKKPSQTYFDELATCPISSVAKGVDRLHNHKTMRLAFQASKQIDYLGESADDILPMLKAARRRFPEQEPAYENIKHMMISQMELYRDLLQGQSPVGA